MSVRPHVKRGGSMRFCWLFLVVISSLIFRTSSAGEPVNTGLYLPRLKSLPRLGRRSEAKETWTEPFNSLSAFPNRNPILFQRYGDSIGPNLNSHLSLNDLIFTSWNALGISYPRYLLWKKIYSGPTNDLTRPPLMMSASALRPEITVDKDTRLEDPNFNGLLNLRERL